MNAPRPGCTVLVERLVGHPERHIKDLIERSGIASSLTRGDRVFLKPNLTYPRFSAGVTTRAEFVETVAGYFVDLGCRVSIGEGPGGYNGFSMRAAFDAHGITEIGKRLGAEVAELSEWESETLEVATKRGTIEVPICKRLRDEFRAVYSLPVPKVHAMTGVSLAIKNLWGCIPDTFRVRFHAHFNEIVNALVQCLPLRGAILDGMYALDENGPMVEGVPRRLDWVGASTDCGGHDVAVTRLLGFDPFTIPHLRHGILAGMIPEPEVIEVLTKGVEPQQFRLKRNVWNRLAGLTWLHPRLTWFVYLSWMAGPIHWAMYKVRRRPSEMAVRGLGGWESIPGAPDPPRYGTKRDA